MYIRTVRSKGIEYVQLAHNYRDPETGRSRAEVLYHFGRKDRLDLDALRRLVQSISRILPAGEVAPLQEKLGMDWPVEFLGARQLGGCFLLDGLWKRLEIGATLQRLLRERAYQTPVERLLFAMVANRALTPSSKLHMEHWVAEEAYIPGLPQVEVHTLYRVMDFLLEAAEAIQHDVFFSVANLFNLEVDLLFLDTTSTYFELEGEDPDLEVDGERVEGLRKRILHSKDKRPDLAQVVIAFAVTRSGIPVRCWVWPGNRVDAALVEEVKRDLNAWKLGRVVLVEDAGFNSETNRRTLQGAGGHYIIGEKLRSGSRGVPVEPLRRAGRYREMDNGLRIKEVVVGDGEARRRYVVVFNPAEAERDRKRRADIVAEVQRQLDELQQPDAQPHKKRACELRTHPVYGRYVRQARNGQLELDLEKVRAEEPFDGKFLVSTSDDTLKAEDVVLGYKQLAEVERVFRDLKHLVDIRPVRHRLADRIRAHVVLCWLAMLLIRVAENESGWTWFQMKKALATLQVGVHRMGSGEEIGQTNPIRAEVKELFARLGVKLPPRYLQLPVVHKAS